MALQYFTILFFSFSNQSLNWQDIYPPLYYLSNLIIPLLISPFSTTNLQLYQKLTQQFFSRKSKISLPPQKSNFQRARQVPSASPVVHGNSVISFFFSGSGLFSNMTPEKLWHTNLWKYLHINFTAQQGQEGLRLPLNLQLRITQRRSLLPQSSWKHV